jgi:CelD/BcsL family acetyltransferase involved in cellulose biosynthesis
MDRRLELHLGIARRSNAVGEAWLSTLEVGGRPMAGQYDLRRGGIQYNVQSGFDESVGHGISPGYLHFGYAIEAACRDGFTRYDFLGGRGKHSDYKARFGGERTGLVIWQVIRSPVLKALYAVFERIGRLGKAGQ